MAPHVATYLGADRLRLSSAALETLAVVAYRQPVTRAEVESIRGVNCDQTIYTLMSRRLIEELGRREAPGSPFEYGTTWEFLECFGLTSLDALPTVLSPEGLRADGMVVADQRRRRPRAPRSSSRNVPSRRLGTRRRSSERGASR